MFNRKQFILVKLVPHPTNPGKSDKLPIGPEGGLINATDPANWRAYDEVMAQASASPEHAVAFVLSADDPYFCVDIDGCLMPDGKTWSDLALELTQSFPGAMVEVSVSGKGLHVWGSCDNIPPHGSRNIKLNIELYHEKRFVVINPGNGRGDPNLKFDALMPAFIAKYFPPNRSQVEGTADWTAEPIAGWAGHKDDAALIDAACAKESYASVFGGGVSFKQLWEKDVTALAHRWPSENNPEGFDASSADASLAQQLAYLTGCDCERIVRLMAGSKLKRDKWEHRPDYLRRTIINAVSRQEKVDTSQARDDDGGGISRKIAGGWVQTHELANVFEGCVYILNQHRVALPGGALVKPDQFKVIYGGYKFALDENKTTRNAWEAFHECPTWRPQQADETCFMPEEPSRTLLTLHGKTYYNIWEPPIIPRVKGDASKFTHLLNLMFPDDTDRAIVLYYMAAVLQYPGVKFSWAPILHGPKGCGKTFLNTCMMEALGQLFSYAPKQEMLGDKNNGWIEKRIFAAVEELYVRDIATENNIKSLITDRTLAIEEKYMAQKSGQNRVNFMFTTNYYDAIRIGRSERRYSPVSVGRNKEEIVLRGLNDKVMTDIWDWAMGVGAYRSEPKGWYIISDYLLSLDIPDEWNPARLLRTGPRGPSWNLFVNKSQGTVEAEVTELCEQGVPGFAGDWISSLALDRFIKGAKWSQRVPLNRRREFLEELGYIPHPALTDGGRATRIVSPDNGKPRLYVQKDSPKAKITGSGEALRQYESDQNLSVFDSASAAFAPRALDDGGQAAVN